MFEAILHRVTPKFNRIVEMIGFRDRNSRIKIYMYKILASL